MSDITKDAFGSPSNITRDVLEFFQQGGTFERSDANERAFRVAFAQISDKQVENYWDNLDPARQRNLMAAALPSLGIAEFARFMRLTADREANMLREAKNDEYRLANARLERENGKLNAEIVRLGQLILQLNTEIDRLNQRDNSAEISRLTRTNENLHAENSRLGRENENLRTEIARHVQSIEHLNTAKNERLTRLAQENENLRTEIARHEQSIEYLHTANKYVAQINANLQADNNRLARVAGLTHEELIAAVEAALAKFK